MHAIGEKGAGWTKSGNHTKQAKLAGVKMSPSRWAASKEVYNWRWGGRVKTHQPLQGDLVVVIEGI